MEPVFFVTLAYVMTLYYFVVGVAREKHYGPMMTSRIVSATRDSVSLPRLRGVVRRSYHMQRWSVALAFVMTVGLIVSNSPLVELALALDVAVLVAYKILARHRG